MPTYPLQHLKISPGSLSELVEQISSDIQSGRKTYCIPINVTKYSMAKRDTKLARVILAADYVIADGVPIVWLSRRAGLRDVHRVTGIDLAEACLGKAASRRWRVFLFGTDKKNLSRAQQALEKRYPGLAIVGTKSGFFDKCDLEEIIEHINECDPDILLLGLGLPQKEYFVRDHLQSISCRFCIAVGGALDIWANAKRRAPSLVQKAGMEWFYRSTIDLNKGYNLVRHFRAFAKDYFFPSDSNT